MVHALMLLPLCRLLWTGHAPQEQTARSSNMSATCNLAQTSGHVNRPINSAVLFRRTTDEARSVYQKYHFSGPAWPVTRSITYGRSLMLCSL